MRDLAIRDFASLASFPPCRSDVQNGRFLVDNIFVKFGECRFRQIIGIPLKTNCAPLLADFLLCSYESELLGNTVGIGHKKRARLFNLSYRYAHDLIFLNTRSLEKMSKKLSPINLLLKKTNKSDNLAYKLDLTFVIDGDSRLSIKLYDKLD